MAEFTELPIAAGGLVPRAPFNEVLAAITRRGLIAAKAGWGAFTIYNSSGDAVDATVEVHRRIDGDAGVTATVGKSLTDVGAFAGHNLSGDTCVITESTGGNTGSFAISSNTDDKLTFFIDPGNGTDVVYSITNFETRPNYVRIRLIVTGGANESKKEFDLSADFGNPTRLLRELVLAINAFGKGWTAVIKAGEDIPATSWGIYADHRIAHVLGVPKITWFTTFLVLIEGADYLGLTSQSEGLIRSVLGLRLYIINLASDFYIEETIGVDGWDGVTTASADDSLSDAGKFTGRDLTGTTCDIQQSTGGSTGNFTV